MPDNVAFELGPPSNGKEIKTSEYSQENKPQLATIIMEDGVQTVDPSPCCSWSSCCDVLGNRQGTFITTLRPLRAMLIKAQQVFRTFQLELERNIKTRRSSKETAFMAGQVVLELNKLMSDVNLNIPPQENQMLRLASYEITLLWRILEEVAHSTHTISSQRRGSAMDLVLIVRQSSIGTEVKDSATDSPGPTIDESSLKERITRSCDTLEKLLAFIDKKTERRWWLRDVINFLQLFIKLALFISAACSVAYHEEKAAPIITLTITVIQGVVEMLDQYFLKHTKPEEIKLSVASTITTMDRRN